MLFSNRITDSAIDQINNLGRQENHALAALSVDPTRGRPIPGSPPQLHGYDDDRDEVTVICYVSVLRTVVVAYIGVGLVRLPVTGIRSCART
ncbi:hypothetical protein ACH4XT_11460 [Streptomyces avidinii]|uniref:hypothetical protein n=1 Tax=Streptomyces avidinii TaxID=1895 RepID=UPI0037962453